MSSEENQYPSLAQQGKNLAKFSWDLINYIHKHGDTLFVSDEVYKERMTTYKSCDKYDEFENRCRECGCFLPPKAKVILDSCPLQKWGVDEEEWEKRFQNISKKFDNPLESE